MSKIDIASRLELRLLCEIDRSRPTRHPGQKPIRHAARRQNKKEVSLKKFCPPKLRQLACAVVLQRLFRSVYYIEFIVV